MVALMGTWWHRVALMGTWGCLWGLDWCLVALMGTLGVPMGSWSVPGGTDGGSYGVLGGIRWQ